MKGKSRVGSAMVENDGGSVEVATTMVFIVGVNRH